MKTKQLLMNIYRKVVEMADLRELILANEEESKVLVAALREADTVITELRTRNNELQSEIDAMKESGDIQEQVNALTLSAQNRALAIEQWVAQTLRK